MRNEGCGRESESEMLRVTVSDDSGLVVLKLEGRLVGPWVGEVEKAWKSATNTGKQQHVAVDLCGVTFVDNAGKELLSRMHQAGANLSALGPLTKFIVQNIEAGGNGH